MRVIAATNKNLDEEIRAGRFREDLYFRLAVIPIHIPPLRERREDVPELIEYFLAHYARELGRRPKRLEPERHGAGSWSTAGRATCASCATWSSGW